MSNPETKISVVVPVFNGDRYLTETLESVAAQSLNPMEIIVVDDGSTDESGNHARSFRPEVRYFHQSNQGPGAARNKGVSHACGDFIAFLDADDLWPPDSLQARYTAFEEHPDANMIFGLVQNFLSPEIPFRQEDLGHTPVHPMPGYQLGSLLVRREFFLKVGPFRTDLRVAEGVDWVSRAKEVGVEYMVPQVVLRRRLHGNNLGVREFQSRGDYVRVIRSVLDRRRKQRDPA